MREPGEPDRGFKSRRGTCRGNQRRRASKMRKLKIFALAATLCIVMVGAVKGQGLAGTLRVTVADKSNASVLDAYVMVANEAPDVLIFTTASNSGTSVFPTLTSGV